MKASMNIVKAGELNRRLILQTLANEPRLTRIELAERTGLSVPAIALISKRLIADGYLEKTIREPRVRGQPAGHYALNPKGAYGIGFAIDRDHLSCVLSNMVGATLARHSRAIKFPLPDDVRAFVSDQLVRIFENPKVDKNRIAGIGFAMPDEIARTRLPYQPETFELWDNTPASTLTPEGFDAPVHRENDATAAAIGELHLGDGRFIQSYVYVHIAAGLGGGLVIDRKIVLGAHRRSGEIGFLPTTKIVRDRDQPQAGTLGDLVQLGELEARLHLAGFKLDDIDGLNGGAAACTTIVDAWTKEVAQALYQPLLALICGVDPACIILGGRLPAGVSKSLCDLLNTYIQTEPSIRWTGGIVRPGTLGAYGACRGASLLPLLSKFSPDASSS